MKYLLLIFFIFCLIQEPFSQGPLSAVVTHAFSTNCPDGSINLTISGGFPNYVIDWYKNDMQTVTDLLTTGNSGAEDLNGITPGSYHPAITPRTTMEGF